MKIAIVHDQLREFGGAERVLVALKKIFPAADIFTSTYDQNSLGSHKTVFKNWSINTSWFGRIPILNRYYSPFRFFTPWIWESFDFSNYDLVISSSGSWMSKGIKTKKPTIHICYLHHPPRYLYGYETAIEWQKYPLIKIYGNLINHNLRLFDYFSSQNVDYFITNSQETRKRIKKFYRRDSTVICPPVDIPKKTRDLARLAKRAKLANKKYYITVSRLARAKHIDILVKAANEYKFQLKVIGTGRDEEYLKSIAGKTVEFLGNLSDRQLTDVYQKAKAFLFASVDEEFGIAPVEAMGYGLPVIAYRSGGVPETVREGFNGFLFDQLDQSSLIKKIKLLESLSEDKYLGLQKNARQTAEKFSFEVFKRNIIKFIKSKVK